ncbi:MAG: Tad domain-containing protein [Sphingomicrobium sp.]
MRNFMTKIWHDRRGNAMILAAAALPLLIGSAGLATDTIQWALWKRQLQRAADSAAIAGVYNRVQFPDSTAYVPAAVDHDLDINNELKPTEFPLVQKTVTYPADSGVQRKKVNVVLAVRRPLSFSSMFMSNAPLIRTSATAATVGNPGEFCVLSLQKNSKTGIQATGNATITMDCGMMTNSTSTNAAAGQGSSNVTATSLAASGGIQQSSNWHVNTYEPYSPALDDPYADLAPSDDEKSECTSHPHSAPADSKTSPGPVYDASTMGYNGVYCVPSISVGSQRYMTLRNGVFIVDGGSVNIQGKLTLTNATLVLTNKSSSSTATIGSLDMNSSGEMDATAPTTGKWAGMAIYQDRRAVDSAPTGNITSSSPNKINGNSTNKVTGVIYFPNQQLTYEGNGTGTATCTQFVAKRIYWSGNSGINNFTAGADCKLKGISGITTAVRVRLVA